MAHYRTSRIVPVILTIAIIIVVIVGLVSLARLLFSSNSSSTASSDITAARTALLDTTAGSAVTMSVRGPIVADEDFRSYQITVTPNERRMDTYKGYLDTTINHQVLVNNTAAYDQLVHALDKANMTASRQLSEERNDVRGICATGRVYEFKVMKNTDEKQSLWTSTCNGSNGSLKASATQLTALFLNQIPNGDSLVRDLSI